MMAILKLCQVRQDTLSSVLEEAGKAMAARHKFRLRAHKYCHREKACGQAQLQVDDIRGITNYRLQQWGQAARERDELEEQLEQVARHRDVAVELVEERHQGWIRDRIHAAERENYLNERIEEGLVEIHRLNNERDPIPHPVPVYPDLGPQVIVADDSGMEVDGPGVTAPVIPEVEEDEDEELEPVSDEDGEAIFDADSNVDA
jgi:hypothetical protein